MVKKPASKWYKFAKAVGWPLRKAFEAVVWAVGKITRKIVSLGIEKAEMAKRPRKEAGYSPFAIEKTISGDFGAFEKMLLSSKSTVGIILGARGTGKSALGMRILENVKARRNRKVAAMGFQKESMPGYIKAVGNIAEIENNSFVLVDEGGILFSARDAMRDANKVLSELLLISRHKDLSVLFISQNSANLDVNAIRQADYLLLRKSSLLQKDFERKKIKEVYEGAQEYFERNADKKQTLTYVYSDEFRGFVSNSLPSFWGEKASKGFSGYKPR
ncbi:MAG: zonular occludens toxin domain-containing protein [Candidatus Micrarchaeota archaeon]